jgi:hypothetical protein
MMRQRQPKHERHRVKIADIFGRQESQPKPGETNHEQTQKCKHLGRHTIEHEKIVAREKHACKQRAHAIVRKCRDDGIHKSHDYCMRDRGEECQSPRDCIQRKLIHHPSHKGIEWIPRWMRDAKGSGCRHQISTITRAYPMCLKEGVKNETCDAQEYSDHDDSSGKTLRTFIGYRSSSQFRYWSLIYRRHWMSHRQSGTV